MSAACPSEEQLLRLVQGEIFGAEVTDLHDHLDRCDDCRVYTAALVTSSDVGDGPAALDERDQRPLIGQVLKDCYRIDRLLGQGAMGAVYEALHLRLSARVAVKVLHASAVSPQILGRFRREAKILSRMRHPNVVRVIDFDTTADGRDYLAMDLLEGEDLGTRLKRIGRLSFTETLTLARAIGGGLAAVHAHGIVHRDLKPQNIFLHRYMQGMTMIEVPVLVDFGISKVEHGYADLYRSLDRQFAGTLPPGGKLYWSQEPSRTQGGQMLGTPYYMSPEQALGHNGEVDHRADQWALGAILYECLTGCKAFPGDDLMTILMRVQDSEPLPLRKQIPTVPEHAEQAISRALSKAREDRFPTIDDFLAALYTPPVTMLRTSRRYSGVILIAVMAAVVLGLLAAAVKRRVAAPVVERREQQVQGPAAPPAPINQRVDVEVKKPQPARPGPPVPPFRGEPLRDRPSRAHRSAAPPKAPVPAAPALVEEAPGYLDIYVAPWAHVTLDGNPLKQPTPLRGVKVPAGLHELVLANPVLKRSRTVKVGVTGGQTSKVDIDLSR